MAADDDDYTDDEAKEFAALDGDTLKRLKKYEKWRAKQTQSSGSQSGGGQARQSLNLGDLKSLLEDQTTRSILKHLLDSESGQQSQRKGNGLKLL